MHRLLADGGVRTSDRANAISNRPFIRQALKEGIVIYERREEQKRSGPMVAGG